MSVLFYPESIRILGSDASGNNVMLCEMAVDDIANLPAANAFISDGYVLSMGCTAIAINDNSKHRLNGAGTWVQIAAGTSTYTRAEIDSMISVIDAENTRQQAEINYAVNSGTKNLLKIIATSQTKNGVTFSINRDGGVSLNGTANTGTTFALNDQMTLQHGQYILSGIVPSNVYLTARSRSSTNYIVTQNNSEIRIDDDIYYVYINISSGTTLHNVVINPMLRPAAITDQTYEPYAPTNRQLYEMILQLQAE